MVVGVEEVDTESGNGEGFGFASAGWAGDDDDLWRHLAAEIAVGFFPHISGKVFAQALPVPVGDAEPLQLFSRRLDPLAGTLQIWIGLRHSELRRVNRRHYNFIVRRFSGQDEIWIITVSGTCADLRPPDLI